MAKQTVDSVVTKHWKQERQVNSSCQFVGCLFRGPRDVFCDSIQGLRIVRRFRCQIKEIIKQVDLASRKAVFIYGEPKQFTSFCAPNCHRSENTNGREN